MKATVGRREPDRLEPGEMIGLSARRIRDIFPTRNATTVPGVKISAGGIAMKQAVTVGLAVVAGAALLEVALVPGILIGGAAVLAPRYLPKLMRRRQLAARSSARRPSTAQQPQANTLPAILPRLGIGQAIAKTITYRIIVTSLDFTTNYIVIGELATAAGLSTFNLVAGPLFYLAHEAAWNYHGSAGTSEMVAAEGAPSYTLGNFSISQALAKTVTFRTLATAMDFTTNYAVVGDVASAVVLSATGFVLGPFVYYGHEKAWEYFSQGRENALDLAAGSIRAASRR
jgi:uncharacterized membrane protein